PWPGHATFLLIHGMESVTRSYFCLDPLLRCTGMLPACTTQLPRGKQTLPVGDPPSLNCLAVLARKAEPLHWSKSGTEPDDCIDEEEIMKKVLELAASGDDQF